VVVEPPVLRRGDRVPDVFGNLLERDHPAIELVMECGQHLAVGCEYDRALVQRRQLVAVDLHGGGG
jgi:hypothetical protein